MNTASRTNFVLASEAVVESSARDQSLPGGSHRTQWLIVVCYALAMAWVEAAVVFYLRTMINRLDPYQPNPLPMAGGFGLAEMVREAATLVMLATVGWLAGRTWRCRVAFALVAFGVWDIGYYLWLMPLTGWPASLTDWDVLFLIPLPWWGPVWSPVCIAGLMIAFGTIVSRHDSGARPVWPSAFSLGGFFAGVALALYVFMSDAIYMVVSGGGVDELRRLLPEVFNWPLFAAALSLLTIPVIEVARQVRQAARPRRPALDCEEWAGRFAANQEDRAEPDWNAPITLPARSIPPLLRTLAQFQLGDGGGPCGLIAFDAAGYRDATPERRRLIDHWFREEAEHSRLLGCAVERFGGRRIHSHWSFAAFCAVRRWLGVRFELQVLLLTELVSTAYYRVLQRHVEDPAVRVMCGLILRDEAGHVAFHGDRLAHANPSPSGLGGALWRTQFWCCGFAAASVLWVSHGPCLKPLGASTGEYFREVRRELGGFIVRLIARCRSLDGAGRQTGESPAQLTSASLP